MTKTNASNAPLANLMSDIGNAKDSSFVCVTLRKKGVVRGKKNEKQTYNNDVVKVLLWTGYNYGDLLEKSAQKIEALRENSDHFIKDLAAEVAADYPEVTIQDASEALVEKYLSYRDEKDDFEAQIPDSLSDNKIWEPLEVNGQRVKGAHVYRGVGNPADKRAPVPGTIYINALKLGERVLEPAPQWHTKHKPKTAVKNAIEARVPMGLYVRYCLGENSYLNLSVGKTALQDADVCGIVVDKAAILELFRI